MKKSQFFFSTSSLSLIGFITNAGFSLFLLAGQTFVHEPQPVQSAAETWILKAASLTPKASLVVNDAGALAKSALAIALDLIAACGHTNVH